MLTLEEIQTKYSFIQPALGHVAIKIVEEENIGLVKAGQSENRAYGVIIAVNSSDKTLILGDLIVYNEYEGQELMKYGPVQEDGIIIIKETQILAKLLCSTKS